MGNGRHTGVCSSKKTRSQRGPYLPCMESPTLVHFVHFQRARETDLTLFTRLAQVTIAILRSSSQRSVQVTKAFEGG